jgi:hypothetical protein
MKERFATISRGIPMMKFLKIVSSLILFVIGLFFVFFIWIVVSDEILPVLENGSLTVQTSSTILNHVWVGNEIYLLLTIYAAVAAAFISSGTVLVRKALRQERDR